MNVPGQHDGYLQGLRVLELADETGEYVGKVLAGLGADVVKVEPPAGERTRRIGPFRGDVPGPGNSLYFWHFNYGKRSVTVDLDTAEGCTQFTRLAQAADVLVDTRHRNYLDERGIGHARLKALQPRLVYARITPFGDEGPWADFQGSDLVHLALGGVMMNCGYDPDPSGHYDTPPVAPQMWQAYQIAGEMAVIGILGALAHRLRSGEGQRLCTSIHEAVSTSTETDLPNWIFLRQTHLRLTCRHSLPGGASVPAIAMTKDGRYLLPYRTYLRSSSTYSSDAFDAVTAVLAKHRMDDGLQDAAANARDHGAAEERANRQVDRLAGRLLFSADLWRDGQDLGLPWAPVRKPEENAGDSHWVERGTFASVLHPEDGKHHTYLGARWYSQQVPWKTPAEPPPLAGQHNTAVASEWATVRAPEQLRPDAPLARAQAATGPSGKPFALSGVRVIDLGWMLASAGAGRFLTAMGAQVIKVEHEARPDGMRWGPGWCPTGGRAQRAGATGPIAPPPRGGPNRSGTFMEINSGKLGISLNLKSAEGKEILADLIRNADIVSEGFSPGTLARMGFGYERLRELNPAIIYVQQSGFGEHGSYGRAKAFGPTAQAFSGISEMSGLAEPFPPAGIGYSYLDWFGAYNMATAMLAALYRRATTGQGCHIDASQAEIGLYLTGTAVLDHAVNGRRWARYGNRSPWLPAAPHGAYRTAGNDRWIAIAAFDQAQWTAVATALGHAEWLADPRFADLAQRCAHQDALDRLVDAATRSQDGQELMRRLQAAGVPAGVCQTAEDRCDNDPQLAHLQWMVDLPQADIGTWPVRSVPVHLERSAVHPGGVTGRSGPSYGQDTEQVLCSVLGMTPAQVAALRTRGVL